MTIPVKYEDLDTQLKWPHIVEKCHFCKTPTRYWHENTNNPVCQHCAGRHKVAELPDYGQGIRARKRREAREKRNGK